MSNAPTPLTDNTVANGSMSAVPEIVEKPNWNYAVATSIAGVICWQMVGATKFRRVSPTTLSQTLFCDTEMNIRCSSHEDCAHTK